MNLSLRNPTKISRERNVAGAFLLDQPNRRWQDVADYKNCVICQDTPEKVLMNMKLASIPKLREAICCRQDPVYTRLKYLMIGLQMNRLIGILNAATGVLTEIWGAASDRKNVL